MQRRSVVHVELCTWNNTWQNPHKVIRILQCLIIIIFFYVSYICSWKEVAPYFMFPLRNHITFSAWDIIFHTLYPFSKYFFFCHPYINDKLSFQRFPQHCKLYLLSPLLSSLTDQALEPLKSQLAELETAVQDQRDKLSAVKSNILRNNDKISRMMTGINQNVWSSHLQKGVLWTVCWREFVFRERKSKKEREKEVERNCERERS